MSGMPSMTMEWQRGKIVPSAQWPDAMVAQTRSTEDSMKAHLARLVLGACVALAAAALAPPARAQSDLAKAFAPTGTLRVGVLMVTYFALPDPTGHRALTGVVPDLGRELARRIGVPAQLISFDNPIAVIEAFRRGELDATFIGITADRAAAFDFGPVEVDLQTTYLVPAASTIKAIDEIDRPGVRLL